MNCPNCGTSNNEVSKFCIRCGSALANPNTSTFQTTNNYSEVNVNNNNIDSVVNYQPQHIVEPVQTNSQVQSTVESVQVNTQPLNYFKYITSVLLKPMTGFKEEEDKLTNMKTSFIFSALVAGIMMLVTLLKSMVSVVFTKTLDFSTFQYKTSLELSNLKNLDYLSLIGKNFIIYLVAIFAVAAVFYVASLIIKKNLNFIKLVSLTATSVLPFVALGMIVSPLLGKIWAPLSVVVSVVGIIYSLLIFFNLVNKDLKFESSDNRIYFNLACFSVIGVAGYYVIIKLFTSGIVGQLGNLMDMFK